MQMLKKNVLFRVSFLLVVLASMVIFTAVAHAQEPDAASPITSEPPPIPELANCIAGIVWYDGNRNGEIDGDSEDPMNGASVTLLKIDSFENETGSYHLQNHQLTRDLGFYEFCNLPPGNYELRFKPAEDFVVFSVPVDILTGNYEFWFTPYEQYVKYFLLPTTGNSPARIVLENEGFAEVSVGFGLP